MVAGGERIGFEAEFFYAPLSDGWDGKVETCAPWGQRREIAARFTAASGFETVAPRSNRLDHSRTKRPRTDWSVVPETDLNSEWPKGQIYQGAAEIVSPPLEPGSFREALRRTADFILETGFLDERCGLHLNVSVANMSRLDPLAVALTMDDPRWLQRFGRAEATQFLSLREDLIARMIRQPHSFGMKSADLAEFIRTRVPDGKTYATNLQRWHTGYGYVEFMHCGGKLGAVPSELDGVYEFADHCLSVLKSAVPGQPGRLLKKVDALREEAHIRFTERQRQWARHPALKVFARRSEAAAPVALPSAA